MLIAFPEEMSKLSEACDQQIRQLFFSRLLNINLMIEKKCEKNRVET